MIPPPPARTASGCQSDHVLRENSSGSHVLPNLTPVSSPTAGAVGNTASSMSCSHGHSSTSQLSRAAPAEQHSSSWNEHLAAPEVGGWSIKRAGSIASSSSSQPPRSRARMMQMLQHHQQLQQQQQLQQALDAVQPPRQESSINSRSSSVATNPAAGPLVLAPPPPRTWHATAAGGSSTWEVITPASATAAPPVPIPASSHYQMQQGCSALDVPGAFADACGNPYSEGQGFVRSGSGSSTRAARAAALATMMTGGEAQPKFWGPGQLPASMQNMRGSCGSFSGGMNVCLQDQQQQQLVVQHNHSAPLPGASLGGVEHRQQMQLVQQAAIAAGGRVFEAGTALQQALGSEQQPEMLLDELDAQLLQLLQLRKQLQSGSGTTLTGAAAAGVSGAGVALAQGSAFPAAAMPRAHLMTTGSGSGFDAYNDIAGMACMLSTQAMQIPSMSAAAAEHAPLQLPASLPAPGGSDMLQLQMAAALNDSASKLAALGLDAAGQALQLLQGSDPCLAMYRDMLQSNGCYDDQQHVGSGSLLAGQGPGRQGRVCEVKEKMRQLADVQKVQRQLQEQLLALLQ